MTTEIPTREQILATYDQELAALNALLARIDDAQWSATLRDDGWSIHDIVGHIGESAYGLARLITAGPPPGGLDIAGFNEQRRRRSRERSRAELEERLISGFAAAREALAQTPDLSVPAAGPFGAERPIGFWFQGIAMHSAGHRQEIEQMLASRS